MCVCNALYSILDIFAPLGNIISLSYSVGLQIGQISYNASQYLVGQLLGMSEFPAGTP